MRLPSACVAIVLAGAILSSQAELPNPAIGNVVPAQHAADNPPASEAFVPEPTHVILGLLGTVFLLRRRIR